MMKHSLARMFVCSAVGLAGLAAIPVAANAAEVNVYTYREPGLIRPLFDAFTKETGVKVNVVFANNGLEERIASEGAQSPADLLLTVDIARLTRAVELGVTQPIVSERVRTTVPAALRDADNQWFGVSYRARVVYASKDRVKQDTITYEELADPKWKGKICVRDGQHIYNNALFAHVVALRGEAAAETWLRGLKANLAKKPSGGDREVAKDIAAGQCDIGLGNTYYIGLMLNREADRKAWADAVRVMKPTFQGGGTHVNVSGVAIMKNAPNKAAALQLGEWLLSEQAQTMYASMNFEYPVRAGIPLDPTVASWGTLTPDPTPLSAIAKQRKTASELVDKVGFNAGPSS
jgi:iron(III) transport system substrate-binding protein